MEALRGDVAEVVAESLQSLQYHQNNFKTGRSHGKISFLKSGLVKMDGNLVGQSHVCGGELYNSQQASLEVGTIQVLGHSTQRTWAIHWTVGELQHGACATHPTVRRGRPLAASAQVNLVNLEAAGTKGMEV